MITTRMLTALGILLFALATAPAEAETWPAWRGADGSGVSPESNLPFEWSVDNNLAWKTDLPGRANASPAITSQLIYLNLQAEDESLLVIAIARDDGRIVWKAKVGAGKLVAEGPANLYAHRHNPATSSPVADEQHVWAFFGTGLLVCLDSSGNLLWKRDLVKDHGAYEIRFGMASSPRLWGGLLYVACMTKGPSYVLALDKKTGKDVWKTDRIFPAEDDGPDTYSSPVVLQTDDRNALLVAGRDHVNAYDLLSGKQLWFSAGLKIDSPYGRVIASPAVSPRAVVVCSANPPGSSTNRIITLRPGGSGDVTRTHRLWEYHPYNPDASTPVCYKENVYMVRDDGVASCLDLNSGKLHWRKRLGGGTWRASLVAGDDKVYFLQREGLCAVIAAGTEGKVLSSNHLPGIFYATPAISDGMLYLHAYGRLYAVGQ